MSDLIKRQAAIDVLATMQGLCTTKEALIQNSKIWQQIKDLPSAQPEITDEQAIEHLEATGWLKEHDRQMYEMGIKEQLKDDSGSYDSLIPQDCIYRQDAIDAVCMDGCGLCKEVIEQIGGGND